MNVGKKTGFTIVELLVVIAVLAILVTIGIVSYGAWQTQVAESALQSDLLSASSQLESDRNFSNTYPATVSAANSGRGLPQSDGTEYWYESDGTTYCLMATSTNRPEAAPFHITSSASRTVQDGECANYPG